MVLEKFTKLQKNLVILNLIHLEPHRQIARRLQRFYPEIKPDGMAQEEFEEIVIKRCKDYVSNKDRKPYHKIKKWRDVHREEDIKDVKWMLRDLYFLLSKLNKEEIEQIKYGGALRMFQNTVKLWDEIYKLVFGERENDETDNEENIDPENHSDWSDEDEWQQILKKRKENGNHGASAPS